MIMKKEEEEEEEGEEEGRCKLGSASSNGQ